MTAANNEKYIRTGHLIRLKVEGKTLYFDSINSAKKESRKIQMEKDGGLGRGCLSVAAHKENRKQKR